MNRSASVPQITTARQEPEIDQARGKTLRKDEDLGSALRREAESHAKKVAKKNQHHAD